jgi:CheY-like chemotaxis protein
MKHRTILIVDDDLNKIRQLRTFLEYEFQDLEVDERHSFQSGLKQTLLLPPDILILDMTMPTYDVGGKETGGKERRYAGFEILRRLKRRQSMVPVIIFTQFERFGDGDDLITLDELKLRLAGDFKESYKGAVYYQAADAQWRRELRDRLIELGCEIKAGEIQ